jgi:hypothetical protein
MKEQPVRDISSKKDDEKIFEQQGMDMIFKAEIKQYLERKEALRENLMKAYALIFSVHCNKTMQNRIQEIPNFKSEIQDDPIKLLKAIKITMHDPARAKYPYVSLTAVLIRLLTMRQFENEGMLDYVKRFKQE